MKIINLFFLAFFLTSQLSASGGGAAAAAAVTTESEAEAQATDLFIELNSEEGKTLIKSLVTEKYPDELPPCRLKGSYSLKDSKYPKGDLGTYLVHFSLPRDLEAFLPEEFAGEEKDISTDSLEVKNILKDETEKTQLIRSVRALAYATGKSTAISLKNKQASSLPAAASSITHVTEEDIARCALPMEYIISRLFFDEPAQGFLVIQAHRGKNFLRGITWYCPFTTWSKKFRWNLRKCSLENLETLIKLKAPRKGDDGSTTFEDLAELSILCASGCGGDLLDIVKYSIFKSKTYTALITDAKETIMSFYEYFGFKPVPATALFLPTKKATKTVRKPYYHWFSTKTPAGSESPAHLYLTSTSDFYSERNVLDRHKARPKLVLKLSKRKVEPEPEPEPEPEAPEAKKGRRKK